MPDFLEMNSVKVVIPLYKINLNESESLSLRQSVQVLKDHPFTIVCPEHLNLSEAELFFKNVQFEVKRFPSHFFKDIEGYNRLMLSEAFYNQFSNVKYILICQTDVFVINDQLNDWCSQGFDYIGAPWIGTPRTFWNKSLTGMSNFFKKGLGKEAKRYDHLFRVGNGGFSLRNVEKHRYIVSKYKNLIEEYLKVKGPENYHVEDVFFSLKVPILEPDFNIPDWKVALKFCMDRKPKLAMKYNHNELPFAIHGFDKPKVKDFWNKIIRNLENRN